MPRRSKCVQERHKVVVADNDEAIEATKNILNLVKMSVHVDTNNERITLQFISDVHKECVYEPPMCQKLDVFFFVKINIHHCFMGFM